MSTLPHKAAAKLAALDGASIDARDAMLSATRRIGDLEKALNRSGNPPEDAAGVEFELGRLRAVRQQQSRRHSELAATVSAIGQWLHTVPPFATLEMAKPTTVNRRKDETLPAAIARTRDEINDAQQELRVVRTAPLPKADLKVKAAAYVQGLVERGRPKISAGNDGVFKVSFEDRNSYVASSCASMATLLAWLHPDEMTARLEQEIDALPENKSALTAQDKEARVSELKANLDALERMEEALVEAAIAEGIDVMRRSNASPLAVLGVAFAVSKPKTERVRTAA